MVARIGTQVQLVSNLLSVCVHVLDPSIAQTMGLHMHWELE